MLLVGNIHPLPTCCLLLANVQNIAYYADCYPRKYLQVLVAVGGAAFRRVTDQTEFLAQIPGLEGAAAYL